MKGQRVKPPRTCSWFVQVQPVAKVNKLKVRRRVQLPQSRVQRQKRLKEQGPYQVCDCLVLSSSVSTHVFTNISKLYIVYIYTFIYLWIHLYPSECICMYICEYAHMYTYMYHVFCIMHNVEYLLLCCTPTVSLHPGRRDEIKPEKSSLQLGIPKCVQPCEVQRLRRGPWGGIGYLPLSYKVYILVLQGVCLSWRVYVLYGPTPGDCKAGGEACWKKGCG